MASRKKITAFLDHFLDPEKISDASVNGLQVEGAEQVRRVGLAVDACLQTYQLAVEASCQLLVVHHGIIWNGIRQVAGPVRTQIQYLLDHDLNLYASHLPLDRHPQVGNNARLAQLLGLTAVEPAFDYHGIRIGVRGRWRQPLPAAEVAERLHAAVGGRPRVLPFGKKKLATAGIVSGGAADMVSDAIGLGLDCFITGESAHQNHHQAREAGIHVVFGGHYETETPGVKAVGELLRRKIGVQVQFLDVPTLV